MGGQDVVQLVLANALLQRGISREEYASALRWLDDRHGNAAQAETDVRGL